MCLYLVFPESADPMLNNEMGLCLLDWELLRKGACIFILE